MSKLKFGWGIVMQLHKMEQSCLCQTLLKNFYNIKERYSIKNWRKKNGKENNCKRNS